MENLTDKNAFLKGKVICWDMDETIGYFWPLFNRFFNFNSPEIDNNPLVLRYGIKEILKFLSDSGAKNILTSAGDEEYVTEAMATSGLTNSFDEIFTGDQIFVGYGKLYLPVAKRMGLSQSQALSDMIVVGDSDHDQPADIPGMLFLYHPKGYLYDAELPKSLITFILTVGNGDFVRGFEQASSMGVDGLANGIRLSLTQRPLSNQSRFFKELTGSSHKNPMVQIEEAEKYLIEPVLIR